MAKSQKTINQTDRAISDPDKIAKLYGIDQAQARVIYAMMTAVEDAIKELILVQSKIVREQAQFIQKQTGTAHAIERELGRERDARTILGYIEASLTGKISSIQNVIAGIFTPIVAGELEKLDEQELDILLAAVKTALEKVKD